MRFRMLLLVAAVLGIVAPSAAAGPDTGELKVALIAPLSGGVEGFGTPSRNGFLLAVDEWNARGGVLGMRIVPIIEDSLGNPAAAASKAATVISRDEVHYIIGDVFSEASIAISEVANAMEVIEITPTSTNADVTVDRSGATKPYIFRACFDDTAQGRADASFALRGLKSRTAFVLSDPGDRYVNGLARSFVAAYTENGGRVVGHETYSDSDYDFTRTLDAIKAANPDVVYMPAISAHAINVANTQAKDRGMKTVFLGGDGWDNEDVSLQACEGDYFSTHYWIHDGQARVQAFQKAYNTKYSRAAAVPPFITAGLTYDAANLLLTAIQKAGRDDTLAVKAALEKISFDGVGGRIRFDAQHNAVKSLAVIHIVEGKAVFDSWIAP